MALTVLISAALCVTTACGSAGSPSAGRSSAASSASASSRPPCPNPEGVACLGELDAGTYQTSVFAPKISYTVPDGWFNYEDTRGNFLLVPPDGDLPGVNAGTSDFIGVYASVAAPNGCNSGTAPGVPVSAAGMADWLRTNPAFATPAPQATTVGGLSGVVVDLRLSPGWQQTCPYSQGVPLAPMIVGVGRSELDHNVIPGQVTRLYLLDHAGEVVAIEVVDIRDAGKLDAYSRIVGDLKFAA